MLKLIILSTLISTAFIAGGRTTYSVSQIQKAHHGSFKFAPDPSNIWSFHESVLVNRGQRVDVPVLVDFDGNGKMDTENKSVRILITDIQIQAHQQRPNVTLHDNKGEIWNMTPDTVGSFYYVSRKATHFATPLALPVGSDLKVKIDSPAATAFVTIHIIGRIVTL